MALRMDVVILSLKWGNFRKYVQRVCRLGYLIRFLMDTVYSLVLECIWCGSFFSQSCCTCYGSVQANLWRIVSWIRVEGLDFNGQAYLYQILSRRTRCMESRSFAIFSWNTSGDRDPVLLRQSIMNCSFTSMLLNILNILSASSREDVSMKVLFTYLVKKAREWQMLSARCFQWFIQMMINRTEGARTHKEPVCMSDQGKKSRFCPNDGQQLMYIGCGEIKTMKVGCYHAVKVGCYHAVGENVDP